MNSSLTPPVRFADSMEMKQPDEVETAMDLMETMRGICETTYAHSGHAIRSVHAKSHGLLNAEVHVSANLDPQLAQGIFAGSAVYAALMRFSTTPGDLLPDTVSTPRGVGLKIINVPGERLPESAGANQDFLMVNGPVFAAPDGRGFLKNLKLLAATTDRSPTAKVAASATLRLAERVIEAFGGASGTLKALGGHPMTNLLGETYFTQVPVLYGDYIAKLSLAPKSANLLDLKNKVVDLSDDDDGLRHAVSSFFATQDAEWELRVQLCRDTEKMPIEDASVEWPDALSPYMPVAIVYAKAQPGWTPALSKQMDDGMRFSPWNGVAAHRPLGSVMRVRKLAYDMSAKFRSERNPTPVTEPERAMAP